MKKHYRLTYYPWITQHMDLHEITAHVQQFSNALESELASVANYAVSVDVLPPMEVKEQIAAITSGACEIALMNPLGFVFAHIQEPKVTAIVLAQRIIDGKVGNTYFAQLYTREKSGIRSIEDVRGRAIGFGVPYSTSNFLIPAYELSRAGIHPFTSFRRVEFLGGHDVVAKAVYDGRVDVGAGHDGVISDLARQPSYGDAERCLARILRSDPIPSDPVAACIPDSERYTLQSALIAVGKTQQGRDALAKFWGNAQGLSAISASAYNNLAAAIKTLGLKREDLIK